MNKEALVIINDDGTEAVILSEDGFTASLADGVWYEGILYDFYEQNEFRHVFDEKEVSAIMFWARKALGVYSPNPPGRRFAHLIEPLNQLHQSLEGYKVGRLDPPLENFRRETVREWARLSLGRFALRSAWIALLWETLNSGNLTAYPDAHRLASGIAHTIHLSAPPSENKHEQQIA
jgi:hypothetical protein